ncbi:YdhK family protein [Oceanobacillus sp. CF4.6]|uniref:YdhK family protein n=1 Tax=Oceanobacillus sp. CF4.6 TaxID=3373080 RepID=UPI003EE6B463
MKSNRLAIGLVSIVSIFLLSACTGGTEDTNLEENTDLNTEQETEDGVDEGMEGDHSGMNHSGSGDVPEGLEEASNPTYEVGSQAIIEADHMEGMQGTEATITAAYDTTAYTVSYTPTTGGDSVENHKWVVHEEMEDAGDQPLETGEEVTLNANHMEGMEGAKAEIDSAEETTVYMVDYTSTTGEEVTNHKWLTESELAPVE